MSAYNNGRPTPILSISNANPLSTLEEEIQPTSAVPNVFEKIEAIVNATRQLETALSNERIKTRKLREELNSSIGTYDRLLKEAESKNNEITSRNTKLEASLLAFREHEKKLLGRLTVVSAEFKRIKTELDQYKAAWTEVLQREREAKLILREADKNSQRLAELESSNKEMRETLAADKVRKEQLERHSKSYQLELQNTLVRLHSAEAKFSEITKELQLANQSKQNVDEEIAKIEQSIKERYEWELRKEREQMRTQYQKETALEREQIRQQLRESPIFQEELQRVISIQKEQLALQVKNEIHLEAKTEAERIVNQERERLAQVRESMQIDICRYQEMLQQLRMENTNYKTKVNETEQELTKTNELRPKIERLQTELDQFTEDNRRIKGELIESKTELSNLNRENQILKARTAREAARKDLIRVEEYNKLKDQMFELEARLAHEKRRAREAALSAERKVDEIIISERKRASELVQKMKPRRKKTVEKDVEVAVFESAFTAESERSKSLESALIAEKVRFDEMAALLQAEVERLRFEYPIKDLLMAKELEIEAIQNDLEDLPGNTPNRYDAEKQLEILMEQRDRLSLIVSESERRISAQVNRIARATEINTFLAEPAQEETQMQFITASQDNGIGIPIGEC